MQNNKEDNSTIRFREQLSKFKSSISLPQDEGEINNYLTVENVNTQGTLIFSSYGDNPIDMYFSAILSNYGEKFTIAEYIKAKENIGMESIEKCNQIFLELGINPKLLPKIVGSGTIKKTGDSSYGLSINSLNFEPDYNRNLTIGSLQKLCPTFNFQELDERPMAQKLPRFR